MHHQHWRNITVLLSLCGLLVDSWDSDQYSNVVPFGTHTHAHTRCSSSACLQQTIHNNVVTVYNSITQSYGPIYDGRTGRRTRHGMDQCVYSTTRGVYPPPSKNCVTHPPRKELSNLHEIIVHNKSRQYDRKIER